jgi:uncharacterized short protein YbdD (DUF466 family)
MKINDKTKAPYEVLDFTKRDIIGVAIADAFLIPLDILGIIHSKDQIVYFIGCCLVLIFLLYALASPVLLPEQMIFDNDGFIHLKRNRLNGKEIKDVYLWKDIKYITGCSVGLGEYDPYITIMYKKRPITIPCSPAKYKEFAKLAVKYSGRKNITE